MQLQRDIFLKGIGPENTWIPFSFPDFKQSNKHVGNQETATTQKRSLNFENSLLKKR